MAMKAVGDQQVAIDFIDGDRRQPIPRVGIALDREIVEAVAQVEVRVEDEVVQRHFADIHGAAPSLSTHESEMCAIETFPKRPCRPMIGSGRRRLASSFLRS